MATLYLTGSSGGLGRGIRTFYLDKGWNVAGFDAFDDHFEHDKFSFATIDSTNEMSVDTAFNAASLKFGVPDQLIATIGGIKPPVNFEEMSFIDFLQVVNLNLVSTFVCTKEAVKLMKPLSKGSLVTIGAETALHPEPKKAAYIAAKRSVIAFTQAIAEETKGYGVTANCIIPKVIATKASEEWGTPEEFKRWTKPEDIAAMCFFLASDAGKAINGAQLRLPNKA